MLNQMKHTVLSLGTFIFHTPPLALLSSSLMKQKATTLLQEYWTENGFDQLQTTSFHQYQTAPFIPSCNRYNTTREPLQFNTSFVMSGEKGHFVALKIWQQYQCLANRSEARDSHLNVIPTTKVLSHELLLFSVMWKNWFWLVNACSKGLTHGVESANWFYLIKFGFIYSPYFALCACSILINIKLLFRYLFFHNRNELKPLQSPGNLQP